jgi:hypothetical protein
MALDSPTIQAFALNLEHLTNVETLLSLAYIVPLLNIVKNLIKLEQAQDVFVIDLVQVIKLNQVELHAMFLDPFITFKYDSFASFQTLVKGKHEII